MFFPLSLLHDTVVAADGSAAAIGGQGERLHCNTQRQPARVRQQVHGDEHEHLSCGGKRGVERERPPSAAMRRQAQAGCLFPT